MFVNILFLLVHNTIKYYFCIPILQCRTAAVERQHSNGSPPELGLRTVRGQKPGLRSGLPMSEFFEEMAYRRLRLSTSSDEYAPTTCKADAGNVSGWINLTRIQTCRVREYLQSILTKPCKGTIYMEPLGVKPRMRCSSGFDSHGFRY